MSESIRRKSSRNMLQNLIRVTEQRNQEDLEEVERERRRRAREHERPTLSLRPKNHKHVLEADEGFGDWSHRLDHLTELKIQDQRPEPGEPGALIERSILHHDGAMDWSSWRRERSSEDEENLQPQQRPEGEELFSGLGPMSPTFKKLLIQFYPDEVNSRAVRDAKEITPGGVLDKKNLWESFGETPQKDSKDLPVTSDL